MIQIEKIDTIGPFSNLKYFYNLALSMNQKNIEALCISSFNKKYQEVSSRYVNIKYIEQDKLFFFTNYESKKAIDFLGHNQVAAVFFWNEINVQIRIKAEIFFVENTISDFHFEKRSLSKNALALSSKQSQQIKSYNCVVQNYQDELKKISKYKKPPTRPKYWGGYLLKPYFFEFWEGDDSRVNKRTCYEIKDRIWSDPFYLQP
jgi:pyridoxamine 5'-phosphate oxidase